MESTAVGNRCVKNCENAELTQWAHSPHPVTGSFSAICTESEKQRSYLEMCVRNWPLHPDSNIIFSCREWVVKYYFLLALVNWIHQMWLPNFDKILDLSNHHQWLLKWLGIRLMVNFIMGKKVDNILMHWSSSSTRKEKYIDTVCFKNECPKYSTLSLKY